MNLLKKAARKMLGIQSPAAPFASRDSVPTMLFSLDDDPYKPSPRLFSVALNAIAQAQTVSFGALRTERPVVLAWMESWPGEHYKLLAGFVLVMQPTVVIDIGTFNGLSALALKQHLPENGKVVTFDIMPWNVLPDTALRPFDFEDGRLTQFVEDLADPAIVRKHKPLLESAQLIFMDGPHDGVTEERMIANFRLLNFVSSPILVFDDIRLWSLLKFWRELPFPKLDLTSFGHWSGTGIAEWPAK
jgi:hypothetical protein